ncbi:urea transport system ATP-binding protein [Ensifer sp. 4252]
MPVALSIKDLGVSFSGFKAVDGVSTEIMEGELRVLLGANGAGKTTLMDLISGKTASSQGRVSLYDVEITNWDEHAIARAGIGRKFQIPTVFRDLSVRENLLVASCQKRGVFANMGFRFGDEEQARVDETLLMINLSDKADCQAAVLSHGQTQWLELGLLIVQNPKILLLDEPTAGMTQTETQRTAEIINRLKGKHTILVVEHDMAFIREIAEIITVMHMGRVLAEGSIAMIEQDQKVKDAYLGTQRIH